MRYTWLERSAKSEAQRFFFPNLHITGDAIQDSGVGFHARTQLGSSPPFIICLLRRREERIEKAGPLGKAEAQNKELDGVEQQLRAAAKLGAADGLCMYLLGVVYAERWAKTYLQDTIRAPAS